MSAGPADGKNPVVETGGASLYRLVQRFEEQWTDSHGRLPKIEDFLGNIPPDERPDLLTKLLSIELPIRTAQRSGEFPTVAEYAARFPQYSTIINQAFDDWPLDNYVLLSKLGEGGMGKVYRARRCVMHDHVAVKVMSEASLDSVQDGLSKFERFQREIRVVAQLVHPNIVRALDARRLRDGQLILVMELVDGVNLGRLASNGILPTGVACEAIRQAARALDFAHVRGIVHRDVKSDNLMATYEGVVKLLDLGLAKMQASGGTAATALTNTIGILGTPEFMAPEQWLSAGEVDLRVDVYALGCVLFHLLAGVTPWRRSQFAHKSAVDFMQMQQAICQGPPRRIDDLRPDCPPELAEIVAQAMHRDPAQRLPTAAALAASLERWANPSGFSQLLQSCRLDPGAPTCALPDTSEKLSGAVQPTRVATPKTPIPSASTPARGAAEVVATTSLHPAVSEPIERPLSLFKRRTWLWTMATVGAMSLAAMAGLIAWSLQPSADTLRVRRELATLPGVQGAWWFAEMPWFTPAVRRELALRTSGAELAAIEQEISASGDLTRLQKNVERVLPHCSHLQSSFASYWLLSPKISQEEGQAKMSRTLQDLQAIAEAQRSPVDWHLGAVLIHRLACLGHQAGKFDEARKWYQQARDAYQAEGDSLGLSLLAGADLGMQWSDAGSHGDAVSELRPSAVDPQQRALHVWASSATSDAYSSQPDLAAGLEHAKAACTAAEPLGSRHPLRAYALETLAWRKVDSLQFEEAKADFDAALALRPENPATLSYVLHDKHGLALCKYFLGHVAPAARDLREVVEESIPEAMKGDRLVGPQRALVAERWPNSWERLGDCHLFGDQNYAAAVHAYEQAMARGENLGWQNGGSNAETYAVLWYRKIIAQACAADASAAETAADWEGVQAWTKEHLAAERLEKSKYLEVRRLAAGALVRTFQPEARAAALAELHALATDSTKGRDRNQGLLRDDLGVLLIAAERVLPEAGATAMLSDAESGSLAELCEAVLELHAAGRAAKLEWFFGHWMQAAKSRLRPIPGLLKESRLARLEKCYTKISQIVDELAEVQASRSGQ